MEEQRFLGTGNKKSKNLPMWYHTRPAENAANLGGSTNARRLLYNTNTEQVFYSYLPNKRPS
jgi:hypothetical protein